MFCDANNRVQQGCLHFHIGVTVLMLIPLTFFSSMLEQRPINVARGAVRGYRFVALRFTRLQLKGYDAVASLYG